ncbi:hypothetical protein [Almyronema epifaneia]|uniref:Uncharacterized protein n=1 Tax=Almyronema epifaneia S1 TaxID=2991925 RepID=A0ABW6IA49_9CYAN
MQRTIFRAGSVVRAVSERQKAKGRGQKQSVLVSGLQPLKRLNPGGDRYNLLLFWPIKNQGLTPKGERQRAESMNNSWRSPERFATAHKRR